VGETRKLKRAVERQSDDGKAQKRGQSQAAAKTVELESPVGSAQMKGMLTRLVIPVVAAWIVCGAVASFVTTPTLRVVLISVPAILTTLAVALVVWVMRQAKKARGVASILSRVESADDRKAALAELDASYKKNDTTAVFARAQLEMQDDPKKALATLERIDLSKVMAPVADETRAQRAMIHLTLGDVGPARQLVDNIDLSRHQDPKTRAMLTSVCAEAWARTGNARKSVETMGLLDPEDAEYEKLRPQLYRAQAYGFAYTNDLKGMRRALKKLLGIDVRLLGGFMMKRSHPLLQKEAKKLAEQSGLVPRKMVVQRRM
jgi:hypothetical protein